MLLGLYPAQHHSIQQLIVAGADGQERRVSVRITAQVPEAIVFPQVERGDRRAPLRPR
jgi:hypothetical protein